MTVVAEKQPYFCASLEWYTGLIPVIDRRWVRYRSVWLITEQLILEIDQTDLFRCTGHGGV